MLLAWLCTIIGYKERKRSENNILLCKDKTHLNLSKDCRVPVGWKWHRESLLFVFRKENLCCLKPLPTVNRNICFVLVEAYALQD